MTEPIHGVAVVPPGLEEPAAAELLALGCLEARPGRRAVPFRTSLGGYYRLHLQARLPFRLLRELARFPCRSREQLHAGVQAALLSLDHWQQWLAPEASLRVDGSGMAPGLNHSHYSALEVKNALVDLQRQHFGRRSSVDLEAPDRSFHLHLGGGEAVLSLDGSGTSLHRRGYRAAMGLAPLKENLAAGLIALSGWDGSVPLADPLCGSGTLLIEAACLALGRAPGLGRHFALERWPDFDPALWQQHLQAARSLVREQRSDGGCLAPLVGLEHNPEVLEQARANAAAAGVAAWIDLQAGDCRHFQPPAGPGVLVCNPPYGERLGEPETLEALYADLGSMVKERCSGWTLWLLSGNPELTGALRLKASRRIPVSNGGIDCRWLRYEIR
ncbi:MAG: class I SAM-dependent RNA methyltransferase [Cyanobacteria bacterium J06638_7]